MNDLIPLHDAVASARIRHGLMITWVRRWGRARGKLFDPDLLALVLAAAAGWHHPRPVEAWTRRSVYHLLRCDVPNWCSMNPLPVAGGRARDRLALVALPGRDRRADQG